MTDLDRVLDTLLHDVRSPLGVASGYLRLVREGRLTDPRDTDRALGKAQDALRRISALCADASHWLVPEPPAKRPSPVRATALVTAVADRLGCERLDAAVGECNDEYVVVLNQDVCRVASAIATVLSGVVLDCEHQPTVVVRCGEGLLQFALGQPSASRARVAFDPWQCPGLAVPLACRSIRAAGGEVAAAQDGSGAWSISFPAQR